MKPNTFRDYYLKSFMYANKLQKKQTNLISKKIKDLKALSNYQDEFKKPKTNAKITGTNYFDGVKNILSQDFKNKYKMENISKSFQYIMQEKYLESQAILEETLLPQSATTSTTTTTKININQAQPNLIDDLLYNKFLVYPYIRNGYYKKANEHNKRAINILNDYSDYDSFKISTQMDQIIINFVVDSSNFFETLDGLIELIAKSHIISDSFLLVKGYSTLSHLYENTNNQINSIVANKIALNIYKKSKLRDLPVYSEIVRRSFFLSKKPDFKLTDIDKSNPVLKAYTVLNEITDLSLIKYYDILTNTKRCVEELKKHKYENIILVQLYLRFWFLNYKLGRETTSFYYLELSKEIIMKNYTYDSLEIIKYHHDVAQIYLCLGLFRDGLDYLKKHCILKNDKINYFTLQNRVCFLGALVRSGVSVSEIMDKTEEFIKLHYIYFDKRETEQLYQVKRFIQGESNTVYKILFDSAQTKTKEKI